MTSDVSNEYLRTRVLSAPPEELRLLLLEGAVRFARRGREGLAEKIYEKSFDNIGQCKAIVMALIDALRPEVDPDLCKRLAGLYTYIWRRLTDANVEHTLGPMDESIRLLEYELETWSMLVERLKQERRAQAPGAPAGAAAPTPGLSLLSVEG